MSENGLSATGERHRGTPPRRPGPQLSAAREVFGDCVENGLRVIVAEGGWVRQERVPQGRGAGRARGRAFVLSACGPRGDAPVLETLRQLTRGEGCPSRRAGG
ncbi:hypothetical protein NKH77_05135 [Streptomyces sp. M19]